jgi:uncharacterized membrane protein YgcG
MRRIKTVVFALVLVVTTACALASSSLPGGDERILSFESNIAVHPDGSMTVRETIVVRALGREIIHGIYRDFPTQYRDRYGNRYSVGFNLRKVLCDGKADRYRIERVGNGERIYIGDKDVALNPGEHTYLLDYETNRQLGFFPDHDELYWNVTGNGWRFRIDRVTAVVELPSGVPWQKIEVTGYTGMMGAKAKHLQASVDNDARSTFTTLRSLGPHEGLSIVVSWPKGFVAEPGAAKKFGWFLADNAPALAGFAAALIVFFYYFFWWRRVGKDPRAGTIIPLYEPPAGFSPAAVRYIKERGYDSGVFTAAVIDMAVKGYASIAEENGIYTITRVGHNDGLLSPEEKEAADRLFGSGPGIELISTNHVNIRGAVKALGNSLKQRYQKGYFVPNTRYFIMGMILSMVAIFIVTFSLQITLVTAVAVCLTTFLLLPAWRKVGAAGTKANDLGASTLIVLVFLGISAALAYSVSAAFLADLFLIGALNVLFHELLKTSTPEGRALLDKIEGFKRFLMVAEKDRLNLLNVPERTPVLFEKYLPYALALGVQQEWARQFDGILVAAGMDGQPYSPDWFTGDSYNDMGTGDFATSLGSSFSSAVASSSTAPGSSSGSDSGGSSGDGGGGGGGGGW